MSETSIEFPRLHESLVQFTGCIGEALQDLCSYGLTIGETYVPFDPDPEDNCEDDEVLCSQAWVRVTGIESISEEGFNGGDCTTSLSIGLEVGVLRCFQIEEDGEAPKASDTMAAALQAMEDMSAILCAAQSCEVWDSLTTGSWTPSGPLGGQYGGMWTFTATFD